MHGIQLLQGAFYNFYYSTTSNDFHLLPITPGAFCSCLDALNTPSSKLLPSFSLYNPSKSTPQPSPTTILQTVDIYVVFTNELEKAQFEHR